ncbi:MAG: HEAT repeat domain-containing protein [Planctomycetes bacterium]|nr:HEAT repeat domain-containing protein [Planctomycetota bacterium]
MKPDNNNTSGWMRTLAVGALTCGLLVFLLPARTTAMQDLNQLGSLASLEGEAYRAGVAKLIEAHPQLWDVDEATAKSWEYGLLAWILNARIRDHEQFAEWDRFPLIRKHGPGYVTHPAALAGSAGQLFLIEQIWKTATVPEVREDAFSALMQLKIEGPSSLWYAVWHNAPMADLKAVALHALASDDTEVAQEILLNALQNKDVHERMKHAALTGLGVARPKYATDVILQSISGWEYDLDLVGDAFRALAVQPDERSRQALHQVVEDSSRTDGVRLTAIISLSGQPAPEDVPVFQTLFTEPTSQRLRPRTAYSLIHYPIEQTRPLLHQLLGKSLTPEVLYWAIIIVEGKGGAPDLKMLKMVSERGDVPSNLREMAKEATKTLERRLKSK